MKRVHTEISISNVCINRDSQLSIQVRSQEMTVLDKYTVGQKIQGYFSDGKTKYYGTIARINKSGITLNHWAIRR